MPKIKIGSKVHLTRVSRKYACGKGIVVGCVKCYTNNVKCYPWLDSNHTMSDDLKVFTKRYNKTKACGNGYVVDCYDSNDTYREQIICTESMLREQNGIRR